MRAGYSNSTNESTELLRNDKTADLFIIINKSMERGSIVYENRERGS